VQLAPAESQSCHWYVYVIGAVPDHVPFEVESTMPTWAVPDTTGSAVFAGGVAPATTAVCTELAELDPTLFVAVTSARIV